MGMKLPATMHSVPPTPTPPTPPMPSMLSMPPTLAMDASSHSALLSSNHVRRWNPSNPSTPHESLRAPPEMSEV